MRKQSRAITSSDHNLQSYALGDFKALTLASEGQMRNPTVINKKRCAKMRTIPTGRTTL